MSWGKLQLNGWKACPFKSPQKSKSRQHSLAAEGFVERGSIGRVRAPAPTCYEFSYSSTPSFSFESTGR